MADYDIPTDLWYTREDEWVRVEGDSVTIGVTDYAQSQLGDVVFVELPEVGTSITRGEPFGVIESVKAVSDLYAPISGEVTAVNESLEEEPEQVNSSCYVDGWILEVTPTDESDFEEQLLKAPQYEAYIAERED